jgi:hypothetical protein
VAEPQYDKLELVGLHEPDSSLELGPDGNKISDPLPGLYSVGVMLGGKFVTFASFKAGNYVDKKNKVQTGSKGSAKADETPADDSADS